MRAFLMLSSHKISTAGNSQCIEDVYKQRFVYKAQHEL
jgi:hypothetical protein